MHWPCPAITQGITNMKQLKISSLAVLLTSFLSIFLLTGCEQPVAQAPGFQEDSYTSEVFSKENWSVKFTGKVVIEVDKQGVVNVYGFPTSDGSSTTYPN